MTANFRVFQQAVEENKALGLSLSDKQYVKIQAGFEATQGVTRLPSTPDRKARISQIQVSLGATAAAGDSKTQNFEPHGFEQIKLEDADLQVRAVANNGNEEPRAIDFRLYKIKRAGDYDLLLWDKYNWMPIQSKRHVSCR